MQTLRSALFLLVLCAQGVHAQERATSLPDFTTLMKKQGPAVVNVTATRKAPGPTASAGSNSSNSSRPQRGEKEDPMLEFFRRFLPDPNDREARQGLASGFIISEDGYILTNAHVVDGFDDVSVRLADAKREFKAKVVGFDKRTDVALLKVEAKGLPVATLGNSKALQPGEWVAAIGSPFGFANTITAGIVSAKERSLPDEVYVPFIQTDVAVNPGNSGGPLLNLKGEVVGVNSMIYSGTGGYMGVSFAIPIEVAMEVSKQLQAQGKVVRGRIGIAIQPLTKELAQSFKLDSTNGAVVVSVDPGGPAAKAGVKLGDVVLDWNGKAIDDPNELPRMVAATKPGAPAKMRVWRGGKAETLAITVGEVQPEPAKTAKESAPKTTPNRLGLVVRELPAEDRKTLGVEYALVVIDVARPNASMPILPGDVIVAVNQRSFKSVEEFNKLIAEAQKGQSVALLVRRGDGALYVPVEAG
ncbi:MAG TPA: Do family serine endopeptidase [Burkholderiales bacterium]|nr:Do family serine endopeptidase [Burkholderiales bacterium]